MMELQLSLKSKCIKKKPKKKKLRVPDCALVPLIKPAVFDGVSNWLKMQKMMDSVKEVKPMKHSEEKMKTKGINNNPKGYKPPFPQRTKISVQQGSQENKSEKGIHVDIKNHSKTNGNSRSSHNKDNSSATKDKTQNFAFNFDESKNSQITEVSDQKSNMYRNNEKKLTKAVAMDCEMVGTGPTGEESIIARVSLVNSFGDCLYDEFVKPKERVTDFRTQVSGVRPSDLKKGKDLFEVQKDVLQIIEGRILVGHSIKHDLDVLFLSHPRQLIRDTAYYKPFRDICNGRTPSLKKLTSRILGCEIQSGEHSSVEDAQATMLLYLRQRREWEDFVKSQRKRRPKIINNQLTS